MILEDSLQESLTQIGPQHILYCLDHERGALDVLTSRWALSITADIRIKICSTFNPLSSAKVHDTATTSMSCERPCPEFSDDTLSIVTSALSSEQLRSKLAGLADGMSPAIAYSNTCYWRLPTGENCPAWTRHP
eukprot:g12819.t1